MTSRNARHPPRVYRKCPPGTSRKTATPFFFHALFHDPHRVFATFCNTFFNMLPNISRPVFQHASQHFSTILPEPPSASQAHLIAKRRLPACERGPQTHCCKLLLFVASPACGVSGFALAGRSTRARFRMRRRRMATMSEHDRSSTTRARQPPWLEPWHSIHMYIFFGKPRSIRAGPISDGVLPQPHNGLFRCLKMKPSGS
jgi:hypothetical protein